MLRKFGTGIVAASVLGAAPLALAQDAESGVIEFTALIRDFKRGDRSGGHLDFNTVNANKRAGHVTGLLMMNLGEDGKPVYNPERSYNSNGNDPFISEDLFNQWYHDVPGINIGLPITIRFGPKSGSEGVYTTEGFNSHLMFSGKFLPINDLGFGNQGHTVNGVGTNYLFTTEFQNDFTYVPGQHFTFSGDDDVWAYINDTLVIDLGGAHGKVSSELYLFDGKAFVKASHFALSEQVHEISSEMQSELAEKWTAMDLGESCPLTGSAFRYVDLDLNAGGSDVKCAFDGVGVDVHTTGEIASVRLLFEDSSTQLFDTTHGGTFAGSGAYAGKTIRGLWMNTGGVDADVTYYGSDGSGGPQCSMHFFHAERHYVGSNFKIETNILMKDSGVTMASPLYD